MRREKRSIEIARKVFLWRYLLTLHSLTHPPAFNCFLRRALRFLDRGDRERVDASNGQLTDRYTASAPLVSVSLALKKAVSARNLRKRMKGGHGNRVYELQINENKSFH